MPEHRRLDLGEALVLLPTVRDALLERNRPLDMSTEPGVGARKATYDRKKSVRSGGDAGAVQADFFQWNCPQGNSNACC